MKKIALIITLIVAVFTVSNANASEVYCSPVGEIPGLMWEEDSVAIYNDEVLYWDNDTESKMSLMQDGNYYLFYDSGNYVRISFQNISGYLYAVITSPMFPTAAGYFFCQASNY